MHIIFEPIFGHQLYISKGIQNVSKIIKKHEDMRTKSVSFTDPAKLRSLFGPCYAYAVFTNGKIIHVTLTVVTSEKQLKSTVKYRPLK